MKLTYGHFDILMSHYGQVKQILPFEAIQKQYELSTLQGTSTQITPQAPTNTSDMDKYHPYTPTQPPRHHLDISRRQKTATYANRHQPLSTCTFSHPQTTPGSVCVCPGVPVGVCLVLVSFC